MCDLGLPCGDPDCPWTRAAKAVKIHPEMKIKSVVSGHIEKSSYNPGPDESPEFNRFDPWQEGERTPTHMDF